MNLYFGGIDFDKWIDKAMTASPDEVKQIRKHVGDLLARQEFTEQVMQEKSTTTKRRKRKVHPQVLVDRDYNG